MIPDRYHPRNLGRLAENPRVMLGELNRIGSDLNRGYHARFRRPGDTDVLAEDWDSLLLLDGCRLDRYRELTPFEAPLDSRRSAGSDSREFLEANFAGRECHDTVYVTANPHAYRIDAGVFHYQRNLLDEAWDPEVGTVEPSAMVAAAREAHERFPHKRLVVHFMQPHFPFLGEAGDRIEGSGIDLHLDDADRGGMDVWDRLRYGYLDGDLVATAYRENLQLVLEAVGPLLEALDGKTVLSSDHGNLVGDRLRPIPVRGYGHPRGLYVPELLEVPWQALPAAERRTITADPPVADDADLGDEAVGDRLAALGYR
jgi:hypothetical protein